MSCYAPYFEFYSGESKTLSVQINVYDRSRDCKTHLDLTGATAISIELPAEGANLTFDLTTNPLVVVEEAMLGKIHIDLTDVETEQMISGQAVVTITKPAGKIIALARIKKLDIPTC